MPRSFEVNYRLFLAGGDLLLTLMSLVLARLARLEWPIGTELVHPRAAGLSPFVYVLVAFLWLFFFNLLGVYSSRSMNDLLQEMRTATLAILTATAALAGVLFLSFREISRLLFLYFCVFDLVALLGFRLALRLLFQVRAGGEGPARRVLILGAGKVGRDLARAIRVDRSWAHTQVLGFLDDDEDKCGEEYEGLPVLGGLDDVQRLIQEQAVDGVFFALPLRAHTRLINLVACLQKLPVDVKVVPDLFDLAFARTRAEEVDGLPLISLRDSALNSYARLVKRVMDMLLASLMLIVAAPAMLIIAIAVRLDSPGPIIFRQNRVGENGRLFQMLKFRTMIDGADKLFDQVVQGTPDGKCVYKTPNDPRVTRLGRFLRRSSMDELPQLFNVIKGEMSLVGPRPELPYVVERYEPWQCRRLAMPPGMTGWWQISGRSDRPMHLHTEDDLYYIKNYSLWLDVQILLKTVGVLIRGRGAY